MDFDTLQTPPNNDQENIGDVAELVSVENVINMFNSPPYSSNVASQRSPPRKRYYNHTRRRSVDQEPILRRNCFYCRILPIYHLFSISFYSTLLSSVNYLSRVTQYLIQRSDKLKNGKPSETKTAEEKRSQSNGRISGSLADKKQVILRRANDILIARYTPF